MTGPRFHYGGARVDTIRANMKRIKKEQERKAALVNAGHVGVPRKGEKICPRCNGAGKANADVIMAALNEMHSSMAGCDRCESTGVVNDTRGAKPR